MRARQFAIATLVALIAAAELSAQVPPAQQQGDSSPTQTVQGRRGGGRRGGGAGRRATGTPARFGIYLPGAEPGERHATFVRGLPTLWTIGDSTVKHGRQDPRSETRWGWGDAIQDYFDTEKINIENQALGGTSSHSYMTWWEAVKPYIQPGDYVMVQFGHNDGGTPRGNGDETETRPSRRGGEPQEMHTFGWNIRKYIREARERGATPIVCSLIPRNTWREGRMVRGQDDSFTLWAREAAEQEGAYFINLNHIIADRVDPLGESFSKGTLYPSDDGVHTTRLGSQFNAMCVVSGVKALGEGLKLGEFLSASAVPVAPASDANVVAGKMTEAPAPAAPAAN